MDSHLESLGRNIVIEVSRDFSFGEDALLLAQFAAPRATDRVCDLGTGCGILPLIWCRDCPELRVEALEIQSEAADMARRSVKRCGVSGNVHIYTADLRRWRETLPPGTQDLVTMNPPYFAANSGGVSLSETQRVARHEGVGCTLTEVAGAAGGLLRHGGRFCLCHRPERLCDVLEKLRTAELEPKRLRFIQADAGSSPWLFLCEARKGGKPGLCVLSPFYQKDPDGKPSKEQLEIYKMYNRNINIQQ